MNSQSHDSVSATGQNSSASKAEAHVTENTKQWLIAVVVCLSLAGNIFLAFWLVKAQSDNANLVAAAARQQAVAEDLKRWELDTFKAGEFADVKAHVLATEHLIEILGLKKIVVENRSK